MAVNLLKEAVVEPPEKRLKLEENISNSSKETFAVDKTSEKPISTEIELKSSMNCFVNDQSNKRSESTVGVTEYCCVNKGFSGVLKQRYSDFLVNEIDLNGMIAHLTNTELPKIVIQEEVENSVLPDTVLEKLKDFVNAGDKTSKLIVATENNKEHRTIIHRQIRQQFSVLDSDTVDVDGNKVVRVFYSLPSDNKRRRKNDWPKDRGEYCHFCLYKENKDTMQAINLLAKYLKIKPDRFSYAGTKDARAITVQNVSVFRIDARNLLGLNKVLHNIRVGNFEFKKAPLKLGDLKGNSFVIVLRNVDGTDDIIRNAMTSLKDNGFINYFGLQRFGSSKNSTHSIGLCLLKSEWNKAIDLILGSRCNYNEYTKKAYEVWQNKNDAKEALKVLEGNKCLEMFLLEGLSKYNKDLVGALKVLPRNQRLMYVHAYQSYVWNIMVSKRLKELGFKPVVGDLVYEKTKLTVEGANNVPSNVKVATEEDISSYSIEDIVMPLPGYDIKYPQHVAKVWYEEALLSDGLDINNMRHKVKDYSVSGAYRHVVVKPKNLNWKVIPYDDPNISLVQTDLDRMARVSEQETLNDGKYRALKLEFDLPTSSYATMLVREILKTDTSPFHHSSLNDMQSTA